MTPDIRPSTGHTLGILDALTREMVFRLLGQVQAGAPISFTGLGILFYNAPMQLPVVSLGNQSLFKPALPVMGVHEIARVLTEISVPDCDWHDGFHLIEARTLALTYVSQFLAPPLELCENLSLGSSPIGARQMAAMAASRIPAVEYSALLSKKDGALVFRAGTQIWPEELAI